MTTAVNHQILLASRPTGEATLDNFRLVQKPLPELGPGQVLVRHHYLSLDPYVRGRMSTARSYAAPMEVVLLERPYIHGPFGAIMPVAHTVPHHDHVPVAGLEFPFLVQYMFQHLRGRSFRQPHRLVAKQS